VVTASDAKDDTAAGENVGRGVILRQPQRMPHRGNVEPTADVDPPGDVGEVDCRHQHIGDALVAFVLKMVFGHPESVVAGPIHQLRHRLSLVEDGGQMFVGEPAVVHRSACVAGIVHVDVPGEKTVEFGDHVGSLQREIADRSSI
jgi:hypothetical protein